MASMDKNGQQQPESSKDVTRRKKRQRLATLAFASGLNKRSSDVKILDRKYDEVEVEVARTLQEMNCIVRRSPRRPIAEVPPCVIPHNSTLRPNANPTVPSIPNSNVKPAAPSIPDSNVNPAAPSTPHNSTLHPILNPAVSSNPHNSSFHPNATPSSSNPHNSASPTNSHMPIDSSFEEAVQVDVKRKRGKTMMKSLSLTPTEKVEVEFNELGQPVGLNSTYLSSCLGTLAREMVPMTISDWRLVDKSLKDDLWACIQTRFKLDITYKNLLTKMLGLRWKEAKSRLVSAIRDASQSPDSTSRLAALKPDNIKTAQEWNAFIKEKLSEAFELKSRKFKTIRAKNKLPHTMSRKGYARLAEDMKKESNCSSNISRVDLWCKGHTKKNGEPPNSVVAECIVKIKEQTSTQSSQVTVPLSEDGVAKTFGHEHCGRVRGLGFGVLPSQLGVHMSNSNKVHALENQVTNLLEKFQELTNLFMANMKGKENIAQDPVTPCTNTPQSQRGSNNFTNGGNLHTQDVAKKCKLLNWQKNIVAVGTIASTDPTSLVHHVPLGKDVWKVWVDVALEPQAPLWRVNSEMSTIQQAIGTTVAWHMDFISFD